MKGGQSAKNFYTGWDGNNYSCGCKVGSGVNVHSHCKYVVGSYDEAKEADGHHGSNHSYIPKGFFFPRVVCYNVGDYPKPWKNKNIYFGVAKESE